MENSPENQEKEIEIVRASPRDVRGMQEVYYKTWLATYPNEELGITTDDIEDQFKDTFTEEGLEKTAEHLANPPEGQTVLLAKEGNEVVGVCRAIVSDDKNELRTIYILPEHQGKGIGRKLWEEAKKVFDPHKDIIVSVATYNMNAINFYKKLGFIDTGKRWNDDKFKLKSGAKMPEMEMVIKAEQ
jgi:ribosomal protein S18 acetylase RimI-like enzyme